MKLPNGFGSVHKVSGNRRKPWMARVTMGWTDEGVQTRKVLGYYETRLEAMNALVMYNDNPYDLDMSRITFAEIYERFMKDTFDEEANPSTIKNYKTAYRRAKQLHNMKMFDIRPHHMQEVLDNIDGSHTTIKRVHLLFQRMYKWCMDHDAIKKNYADRLKVKVTPNRQVKKAFSSEEIEFLWSQIENHQYISLILMLIYSGVRISELLNLRKEDLHLNEQWFLVRDSKTEAGTMRVVPIADKVLPFWKACLEKSQSDYVVTTVNGQHLTYENFKKRYWAPLMQQLNLKHTIHETRHTFISMMVTRNVNQTVIKKIVGHKSIMNLTEKVYTHIETSELIAAVNLL